MRAVFYIIIVLFLSHGTVFSQSKFKIQNSRKSDKIHFKLINNLIIVPVTINNVDLSFILDTGVGKTILFNYSNVSDSLKIKDTEIIYLRGLGDGESVQALKSKNNVIRIGDAVKFHYELFAVFNDKIDFTPRLGVPVHGIIGYDLLKDFVVEINYSRKFIRLTEPDQYKYKNCKKCERFNLEFYNNKPYINAQVNIDSKTIPVKLLIDSGGSDAIWLFEDKELGIKHSGEFFVDFLGHGLSGSVYGKRSKIDEFLLKSFILKNPNVAFPESSSILFAKQFKERNGSLAGSVLKRFNLIFDYQKAIVMFKKNSFFKHDFSYNKSGIELAHDGVRVIKEVNYKSNSNTGLVSEDTNQINNLILDPTYKLSLKPSYTIVELRENSPGDKAGLKRGDIVLSINGKSTHLYKLQNLMEKFYNKQGTKINLVIERQGKVFSVYFKLENVFQ